MRKTVKVLLTVALAVLMVCTLVACGETDTQQTGNNVNYTISFETNGGSPVANMVVDGKSEITIPQTTKEGYFFAGWFVDNGTFNVRFNLAYITANSTKTAITVYAKWSVEEVVEQTYTVAFDSNGGSAVGNIVIAAGNTIKLPADPTKTEYSFVGWFVDNNTFQIPFDLDYIKANPTKTSITVYAKWNAEHVNEKSMLTLAKNIDEAGTISGGGEKNCGLTVTVSATTNDGYVFDGWYDGSNKVSAEAVYQFTMPNDNLMLQAQWNKKAYTITLNSNGGQTLNPSTYEVFYTDNYNLPIPQREGFTFLGWYKNDVRYTNNRGASLQGWANLLNQTLKAMWEETIIEGSEFTVKYHLNYGNMEIVSRQTEQAKVSYFPERKGYTFNGWWLNSGIEGGEIVLATKWNNSDAVVHNHLVLYAEWIVESTSTIQLPAPVVSIVDGNKFVWDAITGAVGYEVVVKKDNTEVKKISITETMWQFQADLDAGNYSISFRAKGNGETNTNSQFTTKGYAHKVLPAVAEINFAEQNGYLNWTAVDIAEKYDLYINGKAVLKDTILTTFDMSFYDAGQHTVVVYAKKTGYLTSEATASFKKEHMSTPSGFKLVVDENATTTLSWDAVNHANQYRIYFKTLDSTPLIVSAPTYDILSSADCWTNATVNQKGEQTVLIYIVAIDSNAEYLNSFASVAQTIVHRQKISFANMTAGAGSFDVCVFPNIIDPDLPLLSQIVKFENVQTASYVFIIGQKIVISAKENGSKYTWLGWFDGANLCTDNADKVTPTLTYTFAMPNESKTFEARWAEYTVSLSKNINGAGTVGGDSGKIGAGTNCTLTATTNAGYTWLGWFDGETKVSIGSNLTYTFIMPSTSKTYTAKWQLNAEMEGFAFVSTPTSCTVNGYNGAKTELIVPNYVTEIASSAFSGCSGLTSVTIPNSVTSIGYKAFSDCTGLTGVTVDEGNTTYASHQGILMNKAKTAIILVPKAIKDAVLPNTLTSIGNSAFSNCSGLASITLPFVGSTLGGASNTTHFGYIFGASSYQNNASSVPASLKTVVITGGTSIKDNAFNFCSGLTSIVIPNSVESIGEWAFNGCRGLTSATIGSGVTSIGYGAFKNCSGLISLTIPNSVTSIDNEAFSGCSGLTAIDIPNSVTSIGELAFQNCSGLTGVTVDEGNTTYASHQGILMNKAKTAIILVPKAIKDAVLPNTLTSIGNEVFAECKGLTSITVEEGNTTYASHQGILMNKAKTEIILVPRAIKGDIVLPNTLTSIGELAFQNCSGLTGVTIGSGVTSIGQYAFYNCSGLTSITIPSSVTSIGKSAFGGCSSLTSVTIPEGVTSIGDYTFSGCSSLTSVTIPSGVTSIGYNAFSDCSSLTSVTIPSGVTSIGYNAFSDCSSLIIYAEVASKPAGWNSNWNGNCPVVWDSVNNSIASDGNIYAVLEGIRYALKDGKATVVRQSNAITTANIPASVTFNNLTYNVTTIGSSAFSGCLSLTSVTIPNSVTSIGQSAFSGCSGLTTINCEAASKPSGWDGSWKYNCSATVVWGYQKPTTLTFSAQGEELVPLQFAAAKGAQIAVPTAEGTAFGRSGYRILSWFEDESLTIPYVFSVMPSADKTLYGKWEYSIVGEGFLAQKEYFDSHGANFDTSVMIQNSAMLIDYIDYILFFNISTTKYARLAYLSAATIEQWQAEIDKMYKQRTYANFGINTAYGGTSPNLCFAIKAIESNKDGEAYSPRISTTAAPEQQDYFIRLYDGASRAINFDNFNINKVANTIDVTTSDQLYYALEHGYRPLPVAGSAAELILSKAKEALRGVVDDDMKDVDKIRAIFGWLIDHVEYDDVAVAETKAGAEARNYRAWYLEGVFIDGRAVCDAFAKAFTVLARIEGIPAVRVVGNGHAWNKVYLDGNGDGNFEWYVLDSTYANTSVKTSSTETTEYEVANLENFLGTDAQKTGVGNVANNYLNIVATTPINPYSQIFFVANTTTCDLVISSEAELRQLMDYCNSQKQSMTTHTQYITVDFVVEYTADETQIINTALASLAGTKLVYLSSPYGSGLKMTLLFSW